LTDTGLAIDFNDSVVLGHYHPYQAVESKKIRELKDKLKEADDSILALDEKIQELEEQNKELEEQNKELEEQNKELEKYVAYFYDRSSKYEIRLKVQNGAWSGEIILRWDTKMSKLFQGYKNKRNISPETNVNFSWHGQILRPQDTARALRMEYDDVIQVEH